MRSAGFGARLAFGSALATGLVVGACRGLPSVTFGEEGGLEDATIPSRDGAGLPDGGPLGAADASEAGDDAGSPVDTEDAAVPEGGLPCGDASVTNCAQCPSGHLRCKKGVRDQCVADCASCAPTWLPCWHCPGNGVPRGTCLAVSGNGDLACATGNACNCDAAADCPGSGGGSQTCLADAAASGGGYCATCGQSSTSGAACTLVDGGSGTCRAGTSSPTCD